MNSTKISGHPLVSTDYKGTRISVQIIPGESVSLNVDGILRDSRKTNTKAEQTARLTSSVQTDYEWHEYIVASINFKRDSATVIILANNQSILTQEIIL